MWGFFFYICEMKTKILFIVLALIMGVWGCQDKTIEPVIASGSKDLLSIVVNDGEKDLVGNIVGTDVTFDGLVRVGATKLVIKSIRISANATSSVNVNDSLSLDDFYLFITITAEDKSIEYYELFIYKDYSSSGYTPISDDNFRNAIINCINSRYSQTLSSTSHTVIPNSHGCLENYYGIITASGNQIKTDALKSIVRFSYVGYYYLFSVPKIRSLSGISQMVNLTHLNVSSNEISEIDISNNTLLEYLDVGSNQLSRLDVSSNRALSILIPFGYITTNNITCIKIVSGQEMMISGPIPENLFNVSCD